MLCEVDEEVQRSNEEVERSNEEKRKRGLWRGKMVDPSRWCSGAFLPSDSRYLSTWYDACLTVSLLASQPCIRGLFLPSEIRTNRTTIWVCRDERKFSGRAMQYSKWDIPGMLPKLEETQGAMYEERSSVLRKAQSPVAPKWEHDLFELFVIFGDTPHVARSEAVCVCVCGVCVWGGGEDCTEGNGLNATVSGSVAAAQNALLCYRNKCPLRGVCNFFHM